MVGTGMHSPRRRRDAEKNGEESEASARDCGCCVFLVERERKPRSWSPSGGLERRRLFPRLCVYAVKLDSFSRQFPRCNCQGGAFAVGYRIHHFAAAVDAIAAGVVARRWLSGRWAGRWRSCRCGFRFLVFPQHHADQPDLPKRGNHHIAGNLVIRSWGPVPVCAGRSRPVRPGAFPRTVTATARSPCTTISMGCASQWNCTPSSFEWSYSECECRHFLSLSPIKQVNMFGAQPFGGIGGVDGGIAAADHDHALGRPGNPASVL